MTISVLQWNVWYKEKIEDIASFLVNNKADIICLQELSINNPEQSVQNAVTYIAKKLGYDYKFQEIPLEEGGMKLANAIFSKYSITNSRTVWINEPIGTGNYDDEYRAYVEADIDCNGKTLCIGTVHMSYTNAFMPTSRKIEEAERLANLTAEKTQRYILTGDFNAQPGSKVINIISNKLINAGPNYMEKTWTTKPFSYGGFDAMTLDWRLDYVFSSPDISTKQAKILKTDLSDHLPVLVSFVV